MIIGIFIAIGIAVGFETRNISIAIAIPIATGI